VKEILKLFNKIVEAKNKREELCYIRCEDKKLVGTNLQTMLIVDYDQETEGVNGYINIKNKPFLPNMKVNGSVCGYACFDHESLNYPNWQKIVPKHENMVRVNLSDDVNVAICQIAQAGLFFSAENIQKLYSAKSLDLLTLHYVEEKKDYPFYIKGVISHQDFIYIVMPITTKETKKLSETLKQGVPA
jgi:hypothetical protein